MSVTSITVRAIGAPVDRIDGPEKVKGTATYAFEQPVDRPAYLYPLQATIAAGRITGVDTSAAAAEPGVLAVLTHENAPKLASTDDAELAILQSGEVAFRGQFVGGVVAETPEIARQAASLVRLDYEERAHDVELRSDRDDLYAPERVNGGFETDTARGDVEAALALAAITLDATYTTPMEHNNPMEPHATIAIWTDEGLTLYCATQGVHVLRAFLAPVFGLDPQRVRVISPHVGGGFGSKVYPHADVILAVMAAQLVASRPVKLALTRQQMFSQVGYRTPTIQRIRLGADTGGRLTAVAHDVVEQTAKIKEFAEQTAVGTRTMYAAPNRRTTHRLAALDVPPPTIMRAPGEAPGMFALESAMDEMAIACGLDPIEFRIRNEPDVDPESGLPYSSRYLVACLREGARRFGWEQRDPTPGAWRDRGWLVGTGVAASTYPMFRFPGNAATIRVGPDGRYAVLIGAADIGTGTWTALTQIAADALEVTVEDVELQIGDTALPMASPAGGSSGITCWGSAIVEAARTLRARLESDHGGTVPAEGLEVTGEMPDSPYTEQFSMHAFGAQFAEVRVHADTGEVRVPRLLGVFDAGRIINPKTARSQLHGGMTMGLSMALHEDSVLDPRFGHVANHDFAEYHIATNADVGSIEVHWLDEEDPYFNPMGSKGIGEIGIVGTAAAIANAVHHATGIRVRDLPITLDKLLQ
ncbi:xanthine dehydrogenase [Carbonactinospora thermoautotrophica]|uniref:xanthine dehydrogenase family protein molybdopterin-binding subunit n=1 Tax=Carbonactinospora thermoautotrophica TaxID=1469144 RepID=UPI0022711E46|nr:xanthine dehydrogenase family protein molybdopterin-binding subunit [Carbonactinospora thermoautotrophica]MCX9193785.1 xanthine dehydrogenase [Carbonactinospora thermoautotrophica]